MLVFSIGYFCGGLSAVLLASINWKSVITFYDNVKIYYSIYGEIAQHIAGSSIIHACDAVAVSHSNKCMHNIVWFENHTRSIRFMFACMDLKYYPSLVPRPLLPHREGPGDGAIVLPHGIGSIYM